MEIMYKMLEQNDLGKDLAKPKQKRKTLTIEGNIVEEPVDGDDKQFTAEHIIELCKFLAERSRRNRNLSERETSSSHAEASAAHYKTSFVFEEANSEKRSDAVPPGRFYSDDVETAMTTGAAPTAHILMDKIPSATNNIGAATSTTACAWSLPYNQDKRDILLKIRRQIFERKRQRQLAQQLALGVWRPW